MTLNDLRRSFQYCCYFVCAADADLFAIAKFLDFILGARWWVQAQLYMGLKSSVLRVATHVEVGVAIDVQLACQSLRCENFSGSLIENWPYSSGTVYLKETRECITE